MAMSYKARENVWIQKLLNELLSEQVVRKMEIFSNNKTSLILTKDQKVKIAPNTLMSCTTTFES